MSYSVSIYSHDGNVKRNISLNEKVFCDENINDFLIYEYVRLQRNNGRIVIANTKNRGEVSGSGKKIYKQKGNGTGRAGEKRSPLRKKGGIVFGPRCNRNFTINMSKKAKKKALLGLLIYKLKKNALFGIEAFELPEIKTKLAVNILSNINLLGSTLVVLSSLDKNKTKSLSNIWGVKYILDSYLNPYDIVTHKNILVEEDSIKNIEKMLVLD